MKPHRQTAEWVRILRTAAEQVKSGEISPIVAAGEVRSAYVAFLGEVYRAPHFQEDKNDKRLWNGRPNLNSPAAELAWWARSLQNRATGRRKAFFEAPELWETIDAIRHANVARIRRLYGPF